MFDDDEPKDWEIRDEEPPEILKQKWAKEEMFGPRTVTCPSCKKPAPIDCVVCIFCGAHINPCGEFEGFFSWLKRLFKGKS